MFALELDRTRFKDSYGDFFNKENRSLQFMDFFDFSLQRKFDQIILNPPYLRQELFKSNQTHQGISNRSDLYVYFILKSILHLQKNGCLVAIISDSWLFGEFGSSFKKALIEKAPLKRPC